MPETLGVGVIFDCPCGNHAEEHRCYIPFENPIGPGPLAVQPGWHRAGDTFDTLTLTPSIWRRQELGGCGWHGYITEGVVT
jgi:hypothetical protein